MDDREELDALLPTADIKVVEFEKDYESFERLESFIKRINDCRPKVESFQLR